MLDRWTLKIIKPGVEQIAIGLNNVGVKADQVTVIGFSVGMLSVPLLAFEHYLLALACILLNRTADGIDGALARMQGSTDAGAYLDIVLDFIFYSAVVLGFALANPEHNAIPAAALIFSFMGTGSSFLAFAILAEKREIKSITYSNKGFYYLNGLAEGTETILFFVAFCLFSQWFPALAWTFFSICLLTTAIRVWGGYNSLS